MEEGQGGGRTEEEVNQKRRVKPPPENQPQQQKCPRCDSVNTKFCYYNNYSLTQPRYFCKTCRRYWTQGGTLRNVPVGGGCRKGKRGKSSASASSSSSSTSSQPQPPPPPQQLSSMASAMASAANSGNLGLPPTSSYYSGGGAGFASSMQSMSGQHLGFNQPPLNVVGTQFGGGGSNLALLQGFNNNFPPFRPDYQMGIGMGMGISVGVGLNRDKNSIEPPPPPPAAPPAMYSPVSDQSMMVQPSVRPVVGWTQSFINNNSSNTTTNPSPSNNISFWNGNGSGSGSATLNPNQWVDDIPGYGAPP
ncbi:hypothetical protein RJ640_030074 [Escallonia rubra]|uniref:Dof zinc finger protein n=1 Tax=Escallonia rubra TaxID=112253 RepID=A0AA88QF19_9ASTE|nr:hypothetical protein RJ640_030074 [Escallonia rubra]